MNPLNFSIHQQECSEWCWAAVTAAVGEFYQNSHCPRQQCKIVNQLLKVPQDCCTECNCESDPFDACNQPRNLGVALAAYRHARDGINGLRSLKFSEIQDEIESGHPITVSITLDDPAASGHAIAIYGYTADGKVLVADPMQAETLITVSYTDLLAGNTSELHGKWQAAFRTKSRNE
jgi:hypothetical protein